jgi:hypothetical protein
MAYGGLRSYHMLFLGALMFFKGRFLGYGLRPCGPRAKAVCSYARGRTPSHTHSLSHTHRPRAVIATFLPFGLLCSLVIIVAAVLSPA